MKKQKRREHKLEAMTIACVTLLAVAVCFAQFTTTDPIQEALDFINSPQGAGPVQEKIFFLNSPQGAEARNKARKLEAICLGKIAMSNELVRTSTNSTIAVPIRQFATEALQTYDNSATNTYGEIVAFINTWPFRDGTPPPMTTNTIVVMKRGLEIGSSGFIHMQSFLNDTNIPAWYREETGKSFSNAVHQLTH